MQKFKNSSIDGVFFANNPCFQLLVSVFIPKLFVQIHAGQHLSIAWRSAKHRRRTKISLRVLQWNRMVEMTLHECTYLNERLMIRPSNTGLILIQHFTIIAIITNTSTLPRHVMAQRRLSHFVIGSCNQ